MTDGLKMSLMLKSNSNCYSIEVIFWVQVFTFLKDECFSKVKILLNEGSKSAQLCFISVFRAALFYALFPEEINNGWLTSFLHHSEMRKPKCISLGQACFSS